MEIVPICGPKDPHTLEYGMARRTAMALAIGLVSECGCQAMVKAQPHLVPSVVAIIHILHHFLSMQQLVADLC